MFPNKIVLTCCTFISLVHPSQQIGRPKVKNCTESQIIPIRFGGMNVMTYENEFDLSFYWYLVRVDTTGEEKITHFRIGLNKLLNDFLTDLQTKDNIKIRFLVLNNGNEYVDLYNGASLPKQNKIQQDVRYISCFSVQNGVSPPICYYLYQYRFLGNDLKHYRPLENDLNFNMAIPNYTVDCFEQLLTLRDIIHMMVIPTIRKNKHKIRFNNQEIDASKLGLKNIFIPEFDNLGLTWGVVHSSFLHKVYYPDNTTKDWAIGLYPFGTIHFRRSHGLPPFGAVPNEFAKEIFELGDISDGHDLLSLDAHKALIGPYGNKSKMLMGKFEEAYNRLMNPSQNKEPEISNVPMNSVDTSEIIPIDFQKANNMGSEKSANFWYLAKVKQRNDTVQVESISYGSNSLTSGERIEKSDLKDFRLDLMNQKIIIRFLALYQENSEEDEYMDTYLASIHSVPITIFTPFRIVIPNDLLKKYRSKIRYLICFDYIEPDDTSKTRWCLYQYRNENWNINNPFGSIDSFEQLLTLRNILHTDIIPIIQKNTNKITFNNQEIDANKLGLKNIFIPQLNKLGSTWGKLSGDGRTKYYFNDNTWTELKSAETETTSGQGNQPGVIPNEYAARILELGDVSQGYELLSFKAHKALIGPYLDQNNDTFRDENNFKEACKTYVKESNGAKKLDVLPLSKSSISSFTERT